MKGNVSCMLLRNKDSEETDYLADWPRHYYEIPTGTMRRDYLGKASACGSASPGDSFRLKLCEHRFFSKNNSGTIDTFLYAWTMIKSSSAAGVSFLQKNRLKRELESYMEDFCLPLFETAGEEELVILMAEWQDFAGCLIRTCADSKAYCSTLFGFVPIKDSTIAEKIAAEIRLVTKDYPARFGLDDRFLPLYRVMCDTYHQMVEIGAAGTNL